MTKLCPICNTELKASSKDVKVKSLYCPYHGYIGASKT